MPHREIVGKKQCPDFRLGHFFCLMMMIVLFYIDVCHCVYVL